MKNFITNSELDNLRKCLIELISKSKELNFLISGKNYVINYVIPLYAISTATGVSLAIGSAI
jgi:hypothetical protein